MQNGLLTCLSIILLLEVLCHPLISDSFVTLCVTVSNWPALGQAKRIVCRTVLRFPISSWLPLPRTTSANLLRWYWIKIWKILQIRPLTLNLLFIKIWKRSFSNSGTPLTAISHQNSRGSSRWSKLMMKTLNPRKQHLKNSFLRSPLLPAGTCHSPNRPWYQQWIYCHRNHFRNRNQYGGFSFTETLMLMGWTYTNQ